MIDLISWQFWAIFHGILCLFGVITALPNKWWWTAVLMCIGTVAGTFLAVVPLWLIMQYNESKTGMGSGNSGVLFVCTVPLFPIIGFVMGTICGYAIDKERRLRSVGCCDECGYDLTHNVSGRCPECGTQSSRAKFLLSKNRWREKKAEER